MGLEPGRFLVPATATWSNQIGFEDALVCRGSDSPTLDRIKTVACDRQHERHMSFQACGRSPRRAGTIRSLRPVKSRLPRERTRAVIHLLDFVGFDIFVAHLAKNRGASHGNELRVAHLVYQQVRFLPILVLKIPLAIRQKSANHVGQFES